MFGLGRVGVMILECKVIVPSRSRIPEGIGVECHAEGDSFIMHHMADFNRYIEQCGTYRRKFEGE